jgi:AhpD family alkylhydroperoxidase
MISNDLFAAAPDLMKKWSTTGLAINGALDPKLTHLVKIRASQINDCANCINMSAAETRSGG